ncbi:hypothetical protein N658DRAFT_193563 [Parathielavia hyrcaniae]|uniref:Uncharacterized protein n=1 Tax=Parathielavia hyrcaniae TaxID=113614 RepID=A0AAN6T5M6_9PEZI|nr:hypothetical protein N658DRAFT_193563 [Parathielavia hyrcaniae]
MAPLCMGFGLRLLFGEGSVVTAVAAVQRGEITAIMLTVYGHMDQFHCISGVGGSAVVGVLGDGDFLFPGVWSSLRKCGWTDAGRAIWSGRGAVAGVACLLDYKRVIIMDWNSVSHGLGVAFVLCISTPYSMSRRSLRDN